MRNLRITSEPQASPEDTAIIRNGLARFNVAATQHTYYSPVAILLRDDRDGEPRKRHGSEREARYKETPHPVGRLPT